MSLPANVINDVPSRNIMLIWLTSHVFLSLYLQFIFLCVCHPAFLGGKGELRFTTRQINVSR